MALKAAVLTAFLLAGFASFAQRSTLILADLSIKDASVSNTIMVDSADIIDGASFDATDSVLYYARRKGKEWELIAFRIPTGSHDILLTSPERIAYPRNTPDGKFISFLAGESGRLVKFSPSAKNTFVLHDASLDNYIWVDDNAALVILRGDPNQLLLVTLRPKKVMAVAQHVGREMQRSGKIIAFVHKLSVDSWSLKKVNPNGSIDILKETMQDSDLFTIAKERVLMINELRLHIEDRSAGWKEIALTFYADRNVTGVGANNAGERIFLILTNP